MVHASLRSVALYTQMHLTQAFERFISEVFIHLGTLLVPYLSARHTTLFKRERPLIERIRGVLGSPND